MPRWGDGARAGKLRHYFWKTVRTFTARAVREPKVCDSSLRLLPSVSGRAQVQPSMYCTKWQKFYAFTARLSRISLTAFEAYRNRGFEPRPLNRPSLDEHMPQQLFWGLSSHYSLKLEQDCYKSLWRTGLRSHARPSDIKRVNHRQGPTLFGAVLITPRSFSFELQTLAPFWRKFL